MGKKMDSWIMAKHFDVDTMTSLLTAVLDSATSDDIENGRHWYEIARSFVDQTAARFNVDVKTVTAITAALSPQNKWNVNKRDVIDLFENGRQFTTSTYDNNKIKALKFYHGQLSPDIAYNLETNWSKTSCFYDNILNYKTSTAVTLDSHATRVVHGYHMTSDESVLYINTRPKYNKTAAVYDQTAARLKLQPSTCQAIAWIVYKRLFVDVTAAVRKTAEIYL